MKFWTWLAAVLAIGILVAKILFTPSVIVGSVVPDFAKPGEAPRVDARFKRVSQDLREADEMRPEADGTIHIDDRANLSVADTDAETAQRRVDALAGARCEKLLRTVATTCRLEDFSMHAGATMQASGLYGDDRHIEVFMRFAVMPKAGR